MMVGQSIAGIWGNLTSALTVDLCQGAEAGRGVALKVFLGTEHGNWGQIPINFCGLAAAGFVG